MAASLNAAGVKRAAQISRTEAIVLNALRKAAERGEPCPTNMALTEMIGGGSVGRASWIVMRLEERGLIEVERWQDGRVVTIVDTGARTAIARAVPTRAHVGREHAGRDGEPPVPVVRPLQRVTCFMCGGTSMAPCAHLRAGGLVE